MTKLFFPLLFSLFLFGCTHHSDVRNDTTIYNKETEKTLSTFKKDNEKLFDERNEPIFFPYPEPLLNKSDYVLPNVSFSTSSMNVPFVEVLYEIGTISNMNIVFDEDVDNTKVISVNFENIKVKDALDIIMKSTKYHYEVSGNVINIKKMKKKIFNLNYLSSTNTFTSKLGGDIFGSVSDKNGIKGEFNLDAEQDKTVNNFYTQLEKSIKDFVSKDGKVNINPRTGVIIIEDYKQNVDEVEKIILANQKNVGKQILIEAKILEVSLTKDYQTGIEWSSVFDNPFRIGGGTLNVGQNLGLGNGSVTNASIQFTSDNFNGLINAISASGTIKTISNPRIMVMNGQSALITSGKIVPYWEKEVSSSGGTSTTEATSEVSYNRRDVLDGISLGVTPVIDMNNDIILNVVPILTSIEKDIQYVDGGAVVASAPVLNIKNLGTVIKTQNNNMVVIGGLISEKVRTQDKGVPLLNKTPIMGDTLFNSVDDISEKRELVVILRIKVL